MATTHPFLFALLAAGVATVLGVFAITPSGAESKAWVRRLVMPLLWVASREVRSTFADFSCRSHSWREIFLAVWLMGFVIVLIVTELAIDFLAGNH
jgi:hypothetical protein